MRKTAMQQVSIVNDNHQRAGLVQQPKSVPGRDSGPESDTAHVVLREATDGAESVTLAAGAAGDEVFK